MTAILTTDLKGKFTTWKKGQTEVAKRYARNRYSIERPEWKTPKLPLFNVLCNVPRCALKFH